MSKKANIDLSLLRVVWGKNGDLVTLSPCRVLSVEMGLEKGEGWKRWGFSWTLSRFLLEGNSKFSGETSGVIYDNRK